MMLVHDVTIQHTYILLHYKYDHIMIFGKISIMLVSRISINLLMKSINISGLDYDNHCNNLIKKNYYCNTITISYHHNYELK